MHGSILKVIRDNANRLMAESFTNSKAMILVGAVARGIDFADCCAGWEHQWGQGKSILMRLPTHHPTYT